MEGFIMAAGLGTRLRPLTDYRPKALVEVDGHSLLENTITQLVLVGVDHIVINVHHFANMMIDYIQSHNWGVPVSISYEQEQLMDTGGGLKKAEPLFHTHSPILIHNVDILSRIDISRMLSYHIDSKSIATLAVSKRNTDRQLMFSDTKKLIGWHNRKDNHYLWSAGVPYQGAIEEYAFSGIAIVDPQLLSLLPQATHPYPIIPEYLGISKNHTISYFEHNPNDWIDVGKPETLAKAAQFIR